MADSNFVEIFGNKFDEFEKDLQSKNFVIQVTDKSTSTQKEYNLYSLFLEYKNTLEDFYKSNLEEKYITYKNFIYFFNQFLSEFKKHGIDYKFEKKIFGFVYPGLVPNTDTFFYYLSSIIRSLSYGTTEVDSNKISQLLSIIYDLKDKVKTISSTDDAIENSTIINENDFAKIVFSYSSYAALLESVDIYIKSIYSGRIQDILSAAATSIDPSTLFVNVTPPFTSWPTVGPPRLFSSFFTKTPFDYYAGSEGSSIINNFIDTKNPLYSGYLNFTSRDGVIWISESGINSINSIMQSLADSSGSNSLDLIYLKMEDEYLASIGKDLSKIDKVLDNLNLSQDKFLSNVFFSDSRNKPIIDFIFKTIMDEHNLCYPVVRSICIAKVNDIKNKYSKALSLSEEDAKLIFEGIYNDFIQNDNKYQELSWSSIGNSGEYFKNNRVIVNNISENHMLYLMKNTDLDYLALFKSSINYNDLLNFIKEKILKSNKEIDLAPIFLNYLNSITDDYSARINNIYKDPNSIIYSNLDNYIKEKLEKRNRLKVVQKIKNTLTPKDQYYDNGNAAPIDLKSAYKASLDLQLDLELKIAMFSSRLNFLGNQSYRDFIEAEKLSIEKFQDETKEYLEILNNPKLLKEVGRLKVNNTIKTNDLINLVSKLIVDNFKKEGQLLQSGNEDKIQVKIPEFSEEKKSDVYTPKNISFAKLSILLESININGLDLSISFSEFLNGLKSELKHSKKNNAISSSDLVTSLALLWIKRLSRSEENSSADALAKNLMSFFENLPLLINITTANETLKKYVLNRKQDINHQMENKFIEQSKFSKIETFKNLSSLLKFYHNNEKVDNIYYLIINSKNFNKLYLNNYQVFLKSFIDFNYLLKNNENKSSEYYDDFEYEEQTAALTPLQLKRQIYDLKEELSNDQNFSPERLEKLLPSNKIEEIIFFDLESCDISPESFDDAFDKMQGVFDTKKISSLNNIISIIKQINDIRKYIVHAKPKNDLVLNNNYMFAGNQKTKFRFRTLGDIDPQHFTIGVDTRCCQIIGGAGESAAIDSFINPNASVIILEVNIDSIWTAISQSYFHVVPKEKYLILDNIEAGKYNNDYLKSIIGYNFFEAYAILAQAILKKGFKKVLCGKKHTNVLNEDFSKFKTDSIKKDPRHFEIETESFKELNETSEKYTDFNPYDCYNLGKPNFKIPDATGLVFTASNNLKNDMLLKISNSVLRKSIDNLNLIKLSNYLSSINLINYSSRVLFLGK